eukprot:8642991-Pyramimonas_sp.AAC.1
MLEVMDKAVRKYAGRFGLDAAGLLQAASVKQEELQKQLPKPPAACAAFPPGGPGSATSATPPGGAAA